MAEKTGSCSCFIYKQSESII